MRRIRITAALLTLFVAASSAAAEIVAVKAGRLIDPKAGAVVPGAVILVENGRVKAVGPALAIPAGATVVDLSSLTVLPGLIDCHTHLVGDYVHDKDPLSDLKKSAADRAFESVPNARATLEAGFTTVRDVGTYRAFVDVAMRDAIARGDFPGPRMFVAGAYLTITGGGGAITGFAPDVALPWDLRFGIADGVDQVRQRVRDIAQHDVDLIKVLATGAFLTHGSDPHAVEYGDDELRAAVEEAAHKGLKVAAHAHSTDGIKLAVKAGVASFGDRLGRRADRPRQRRGLARARQVGRPDRGRGRPAPGRFRPRKSRLRHEGREGLQGHPVSRPTPAIGSPRQGRAGKS